MVQIAGAYVAGQLVNLTPAQVGTKLIVDGYDDSYIFKWIHKDSSRLILKFSLNTPYRDFIGGQEVTTIVNRDGYKLIFTSTSLRRTVRRIYEFDDVGVVMTFKAVGTTDTFQVYYRRV